VGPIISSSQVHDCIRLEVGRIAEDAGEQSGAAGCARDDAPQTRRVSESGGDGETKGDNLSTTRLRDGLPPLPQRIRKLPIDGRGFVVPWFVAWIDGKADFRIIRKGGIAAAHHDKTCWLCGDRLGVYLTFVIGPTDAINRAAMEPPSHLACAEFAAKACPFLTAPMAKHNEHNMPEGTQDPAAIGLKRNPGVTCLWTTKSYSLMYLANGVLFRFGEPESVSWWCRGRAATRAEVDESIASWMPLLVKAAEDEGVEAVATLAKNIERAQPLLPTA